MWRGVAKGLKEYFNFQGRAIIQVFYADVEQQLIQEGGKARFIGEVVK
jgi:hypothetical protein